jgi:adenosylhomocysteine nucleosidase
MLAVTIPSASELKKLAGIIAIKQQSVSKGALIFTAALEGRELLLVRTGIGTKKARDAARQLLDLYTPELVIATGAAGALDPALKIADIVVSRTILRPPQTSFTCDADLSRQAFEAMGRAGMPVVWGDCACMNRFVHMRSEKAALFSETRARIVDMESAALAGVLCRAGIPLLNIRVVSDVASADTADVAGIVASQKAAGLPGVCLRFLKNPRDAVRAAKLMRDISRSSGVIAAVVTCVVKEFA